MKLFSQFLGLFILSLSLSANADESTDRVMNSNDPYENFNRSMFEFNIGFNNHVGKPLTNFYESALPQPAKTGVSNFFDNLTTPLSALNSFLQGKGEDGFSEIMRFSLNSTFGFFGLIDIASAAGLEAKDEDFGQTLYHWGVWEESSYLVLPILGPYTTRELAGGTIDTISDPVYPNIIKTDSEGRIWIFIGDKFVEYTQVAGLIDEVQNQPDPYVFARESYLQHRTNQIYDGNVPQPNLDDFDFD